MHLQRYGLAVLSVGVALGAALLLQHFHFRDAAVPLLLLAVAITSWYGGPGPAVLAVVLSSMCFELLLRAATLQLAHRQPSDLPYDIIFASFAALIVMVRHSSAPRRRRSSPDSG